MFGSRSERFGFKDPGYIACSVRAGRGSVFQFKGVGFLGLGLFRMSNF